MSAPKSVIKLKKDWVEYTSNCDKAQYYIYELSRAALRDVGKFCKKKFRESYYSHFKRHTGQGGKAFKYVIHAGKKEQEPKVEMGIPHSQKGYVVRGFYSYFQEYGSSKQPKMGLITKAVEGNIAEIVKIESQYLSALEDEAKALALIDEGEMVGEIDED